LPAYPSVPNAPPFSARACELHKRTQGSTPCSVVGDLQHTLLHCPHMKTHMRSIYPTFNPPSVEAFFKNQDLQTLAMQSSLILGFISKAV
jgi:hypothetical protein